MSRCGKAGGLIDQHHRTASAEIEIIGAHVLLVMRREVVDHSSTGTEFFNRIAVVDAARIDIEVAVAGNEVNVSCGIGCQSSAACQMPPPLPLGVAL